MNHAYKLSQASNIAIHALAYISLDDTYISASWLAKKLDVSVHHLTKVLNRLVAKGILDSLRGNKGGFKLNRVSKEISLLKIVECVDGPFVESKCTLNEPVCKKASCIFIILQKDVTDLIKKRLSNQSLQDFTKSVEFIK